MLPASYVSGDKERFCPYDATHTIPAKGFDAHLIKCRENYRGCKMVVCPLDHTHVVPKPELNHHLSQCEKRSLMDRDLQKRAGDNFLKGDVMGPPIVADHLAGRDVDEGENWDDAPRRQGPTPALFNEHVRKIPKESYGIIPGGGYVLPPEAEEPKIRKIPNNPAKAATLSNPGAAQIRPSRNQVFEFSVGNTRMTRMDGDPLRAPPVPMQSVAPGSFRGVNRARAPAPDQGPRFIGRGVSKYATKANQRPTASSPASPGLLVKKSPQGDGDNRGNTPPDQFEDAAKANALPQKSKDSGRVAKTQRNVGGADTGNGVGQQQECFNSGAPSLQNQQLLLLQGVVLHQQQQLEQAKQQHDHQQRELAKKHQIQMLQLQKLQEQEKQHMAQAQEKLEAEMRVKAQALSQSLLPFSSPPVSSSQADPTQSAMVSGLLEAIMATGGSGLSGLLSSMALEESSNDGITPIHQALTDQEWTMETRQEGNDPPATTLEALPQLSAEDSCNSERGSPTNNQLTSADRQKREAALQSRLREIEILEQKSMLGHVLSKEEDSKLNLKDEIEEELANILSNQSKKS